MVIGTVGHGCRCGEAALGFQVWWLAVGHWMFLCVLGPGDLGYSAGNPDTFPGVSRVKAPLVRDAMRDGCGYGKAAPRSLGLH